MNGGKQAVYLPPFSTYSKQPIGMDTKPRVRFAPSPTGPLHIGGLRTALFNYLFARKHGGSFILRVEDTDQSRFVQGAEKYIQQALEWSGITPDESPWNPGEHGPYRQSERKEMYGKYAQQLVDQGKAYYAFDTAEELEEMRNQLAARKETFQYNAITRLRMKNSLTLSAGEAEERINSGQPYVIRIKMPVKEVIRLNDLVRGNVRVHAHTMDDKVLMKSDGMPTYHLANVVDDHLMGITHVIRGEEWLPTAPLHVVLYQYLGWEGSMPQFAHLPLLLKPSGQGKLSKRDGDKMGFPVFPLQWNNQTTGETASGYREQGFLPEAFINFLALLGWNPGTGQEIFSLEELVELFTVERIGKAGTKFDFEKAKWFNQHYIKQKPADVLAGYLQHELQKEGIDCPPEKAEKIAGLMRERITFPQEIWTTAPYFFRPPAEYDEKVARKKWNADAVRVFTAWQQALQQVEDFNEDKAKAALMEVLEKEGVGMGKVMQALRLAITGTGGGPDLMPTLVVIGKQEVIKRIDLAKEKLGEQ